MSPRLAFGPISSRCFPRVSGDEPAMALNLQGTPKFSPRERG